MVQSLMNHRLGSFVPSGETKSASVRILDARIAGLVYGCIMRRDERPWQRLAGSAWDCVAWSGSICIESVGRTFGDGSGSVR